MDKLRRRGSVVEKLPTGNRLSLTTLGSRTLLTEDIACLVGRDLHNLFVCVDKIKIFLEFFVFEGNLLELLTEVI